MDPAQAWEMEEIERFSYINETIARGDSTVQKFYEDAVILVTGGSGFLGKQLIEKLFRSCRIQKVYVLLRPKQQKSLEDRINDMITDPLYEHLFKTQPDFVSKLIPVKGDITNIRLGLSEENWNTLTEEVNIIFHGAATTNFEEPLKVATLTNLRGTREMLTLAKFCKKLTSFVHISTAFAHARPDLVGQQVHEKFYDCTFTPQFIIDFVHQLDETKLDNITPQIIDNWPNTYTFTKALAEELVRTTAEDLPICIIRPAIVMPAYREPPGWVDRSNINGPVGFVLGACLGGLHVMYGDPKNILDMVPVDLANNAALVAAHATVQRRKRGENDIKIYSVTNNRNCFSIDALHRFLDTDARERPTPKILWYAFLIVTPCKVIFSLITWLLHFIPGYVIDFVLKLTGRRPKAIKLLTRAYKQNQVFGYFMRNSWKFGDSNLLQLHESLSPEDRAIFSIDICEVDVLRCLRSCCIGVRKYILKDGLKGTDFAMKKLFWLRILNAIYLTVYAYVLWKCFCGIYSVVFFIIQSVLSSFV